MNQGNKHYDKYHDFVLDKKLVTKAEEIVYSLICDLTDRRGLKQEFWAIDADVQEELVDTWIGIVENALNAKEEIKAL